MLNTLIALTETEEFEDSGSFRFYSAHSTPGSMTLGLLLFPGDGIDRQHWQIACFGVRDFSLRGEFADDLHLVSEHPILLPFTERVTDLHFYSPSPDPMATVGALFERHRQLVGSWIPFEQFLNRLPLPELLVAQSGQLASGPVSLMEAYLDVLTERGIRSSVLPSSPPKVWDGQDWIVLNTPLSALILQNSYVIAERFDARQVEI